MKPAVGFTLPWAEVTPAPIVLVAVELVEGGRIRGFVVELFSKMFHVKHFSVQENGMRRFFSARLFECAERGRHQDSVGDRCDDGPVGFGLRAHFNPFGIDREGGEFFLAIGQ